MKLNKGNLENITQILNLLLPDSNFDLLGKDSDLKISTKIKDGNFYNKQTNLSFSKLYSQIDYDSSNGVRDGFATIKINDIPLKFDIRKVKENGNFNTQFVTEDVVSSRKILSPYGIGDTVKGSSKFNLKLVLLLLSRAAYSGSKN